jgi:predicted permease
MIFKSPVLSLVAILAFSLGIGLTTTVFSIINGAMYKGLPFDDADKVVAVWRSNPDRDIERGGVSLHDYVDYRDQQTSLVEFGLWGGGAVNLVGEDDQPERYQGARVTANMFEILRVAPVIGRGFLPGEDEPGAENVLVLGYEVWQEKFDGSPDVLGMTVRTNGEPHTIVGVAPEGFEFPIQAELWATIEVNPLEHERNEGPSYPGFGRLGEGVSLDRASAEFATIGMRLEQQYPEANEGFAPLVEPYTKFVIGDEIFGLLMTMLGAAIGVLLIGCANVANLLFARAAVREKEVAVRSAMGAGRKRIIRQLLVEVGVLSFIGGAIGVLIGLGGVSWFNKAISSNPPPFWMTFDPDARVMAFVVAVTALAAIAAGLFPALRATGKGMNEALKDEGRGSSGLRMGRITSIIVISEVAVSCGLLIAAGLMIKSVTQLRTVDLPFVVESIFTARLNLPETDYPDANARTDFYREFLQRMQTTPGVEAATLSDGLPASGNGMRTFEIEGGEYPTERDYPRAREGIVTPGYFATFQTPVLDGRAFAFSDTRDNTLVALVNRSFVREYFDGGEAIGRRFRIHQNDDAYGWMTVVGVVPDMKMEGIGNNNASPAGYYIAVDQFGEILGNFVSIGARAAGDPASLAARVRETVASMDPNLPIFGAMPMQEVIDQQTWFYRTFGTLFMVFGFVALFLAAVGLYGVMSFSVSQRTREMGIRMALGAYNGRLIRLTMRRGLKQLAIGITLGIVLAALATRPLQIVLYEVDARDPVIFGRWRCARTRLGRHPRQLHPGAACDPHRSGGSVVAGLIERGDQPLPASPGTRRSPALQPSGLVRRLVPARGWIVDAYEADLPGQTPALDAMRVRMCSLPVPSCTAYSSVKVTSPSSFLSMTSALSSILARYSISRSSPIVCFRIRPSGRMTRLRSGYASTTVESSRPIRKRSMARRTRAVSASRWPVSPPRRGMPPRVPVICSAGSSLSDRLRTQSPAKS